MTAVVDRHVSAFSAVFTVGEELAHEILERKATLLEDTCLSILGEDDVFRD